MQFAVSFLSQMLTVPVMFASFRSTDTSLRILQDTFFLSMALNLLLISGLLVCTDWFHGYRGYSIDLVIPILCSVTLVCNFVFAFWRSHFTQNALVYMLLNIGVGVLPYLLLFFRIGTGRLDTHSIPWVICLIISAVTCLGLIIFQGRALRSELEKRLHM